MKYPIGIQSFDRIIEDGYVYIDKTDLIYKLVTEGKIYFLGRPRRFGKSLLVSTLEHYFLGHKELFKGLKIDSFSTSTLAATIMYPAACWKKKSNATWQLGRKPTAATRHGKA